MGFGSGETPNLPQQPWWVNALMVGWISCGIPLLLLVALVPMYEVIWEYDNGKLQFIVGGCNRPEYLYHYGREDLSPQQCFDLVTQMIWSFFDPTDPRKMLERLVVYSCAKWLVNPAMGLLEVIVKWCIAGRYEASESHTSSAPANSAAHVAKTVRILMYIEFHYLCVEFVGVKLLGMQLWTSLCGRWDHALVGMYTAIP